MERQQVSWQASTEGSHNVVFKKWLKQSISFWIKSLARDESVLRWIIYLEVHQLQKIHRRRTLKSQTSGKMDRWWNTVFLPVICGSRVSTSRFAKAAGAEPLGPHRGGKHMSKSKCTKHPMLGTCLEVDTTLHYTTPQLQLQLLIHMQLYALTCSYNCTKLYQLHTVHMHYTTPDHTKPHYTGLLHPRYITL